MKELHIKNVEFSAMVAGSPTMQMSVTCQSEISGVQVIIQGFFDEKFCHWVSKKVDNSKPISLKALCKRLDRCC